MINQTSIQVKKRFIYTEDQLLPLSALQHLLFCERQCALIHVERQWAENRFTAEGRIMHERPHREERTARGRIRIEYALALRSLFLGLAGQADVVELYRNEGRWRPFPVEYKRGRPKKDDCDRVQLCAQAICLEEMLEVWRFRPGPCSMVRPGAGRRSPLTIACGGRQRPRLHEIVA